eukprot:1160557-Pelagomonas_calceolata.AAC.1
MKAAFTPLEFFGRAVLGACCRWQSVSKHRLECITARVEINVKYLVEWRVVPVVWGPGKACT